MDIIQEMMEKYCAESERKHDARELEHLKAIEELNTALAACTGPLDERIPRNWFETLHISTKEGQATCGSYVAIKSEGLIDARSQAELMKLCGGSCWQEALAVSGIINPDTGVYYHSCPYKMPSPGGKECTMKHATQAWTKEDLDFMSKAVRMNELAIKTKAESAQKRKEIEERKKQQKQDQEERKRGGKNTGICNFFKNGKPCPFGEKCLFQHEQGGKTTTSGSEGSGLTNAQTEAVKKAGLCCRICKEKDPTTNGKGQGHTTINCPNNPHRHWICTICFVMGHCNTICNHGNGKTVDASKMLRFVTTHKRQPRERCLPLQIGLRGGKKNGKPRLPAGRIELMVE